MFKGAAYVFFAYIGFDSVSTHAEEARNPQRDVPIGIIVSLLLCTLLYIPVAAVLTGMVPYNQIDIDAPVAAAFARAGCPTALLIISAGAVAGITSVLLVLMLSQARVLLAMARDGLIPRSFFGAVHPRFRTPYKATILTGSSWRSPAALFPLKLLADLVNIGTLMAFVDRLRRRHGHAADESRAAAAVPHAAGAAGADPRHRCSTSRMMFSLGWENWLRLFVWLLIGLVIYFGYGRKHSRLDDRRELTRSAAARA